MVKTLEKHKIEFHRNLKNNNDDNIHSSEAQKNQGSEYGQGDLKNI